MRFLVLCLCIFLGGLPGAVVSVVLGEAWGWVGLVAGLVMICAGEFLAASAYLRKGDDGQD